MDNYNNIKAYKSSYENIDGVNQVILLFESAIAYLQQAKDAIAQKDIQEKYNKISKAYQIVTGLRDSLDTQKGGDMVSVLTDWYSGTAMRIISINRSEDLEMCDMCIKHLKEMREAWKDAESQIKTDNTKADASASSVNNEGQDAQESSEPSEKTSSDNNNNDFFSQSSNDTEEEAKKLASGLSISV